MRAVKRAADETITVEPHTGRDGQGAPSYGASSQVSGRAVRSTEQVLDRDGSDVRVDLVVWIDAGESPLPDEEDRITVGGTAYIVAAREDGEDLSGTLRHVKLMAREA